MSKQTLTKHAGGRPTKYTDDMVDQVYAYILTTGREQTSLPTVEGAALALGIDDDTIVEWCRIHPEFSAAIKSLMRMQKNQLIDDGMYGGKEVNSTMAIFLLKANHGLIETSHTDITTGGEKLSPMVTIDTNGTTK